MRIYNYNEISESHKINNALLQMHRFIQESNKQRIEENKLIDSMVVNYINKLDHNYYDYISFKKAYDNNNIIIVIMNH